MSWEATAEEVADPRSKPEPGHRPGPDVVPVPWFAWLREVCERLLIFLPQACLHHGGSRLLSMHDMWQYPGKLPCAKAGQKCLYCLCASISLGRVRIACARILSYVVIVQEVDLVDSDAESNDSWSDQLNKPAKGLTSKSAGLLSPA